jgi:pyruvate,orthophosphate dikinase
MAVRKESTRKQSARRVKASKAKAVTARKPARTSRQGKTAGLPDRAARKKGAKSVYFFGGGRAEGRAEIRNLLGGKGANLAEMAGLGLPVPPGFTITTEVCTYVTQHRGQYPAGLRATVERNMERVEKVMERRFGDPDRPLLVSVRSGARTSMPGMMDTVLNLGLNARTVEGLIRESGSERFGHDCHRRFIQMFGDVVLGLKPESKGEVDPFEEIIEQMKHSRGVELDTQLSAEDLSQLADEFKLLIKRRLDIEFPDDPMEQLWAAIGAVFRSWDNPRAITYRKLNRIPHEWGTAVNVQAMVFGNLGDDCATGVAFTRNPATGEKALYGEFLVNAQGEDVVAGIRTPQQVTRSASIRQAEELGVSEEVRRARFPSLEEAMPECHRQLRRTARQLEQHYRDMQDLEFTIERGRLWMLQTRTAKRTAAAAIKTAVDMVREKLIDKGTAVLRVEPGQLDQLLHPQLDPNAHRDRLGKGLPASPGAVAGEIVFSADDAVAETGAGKKVVLVRVETSPEDINGMHVAEGILTARGGMTSHAAVVARGMGKCCVAGCGDLRVDYAAGECRLGGRTLKRGEWITLDGSTGEVFAGRVPTTPPHLGKDFETFMKWADEFRRLRVRANADTPHDAEVARGFGAEGIGLCRTEHMFFESDRIDAVREMILASDRAGRERALAKILPMQKTDFRAILHVMSGLPVTIRLLDPPLHEFLPPRDELPALAERLGVEESELRKAYDALHESNPMLGHRGCRLAITFPEIYAMQVKAIVAATCELRHEGIKVEPEIMIPLVGHVRELEVLRRETLAAVEEESSRYGQKTAVQVGTMVELPRAALTADQIAVQADFFSFGTNDLTQTVFGLSRDDAGRFLPSYVERSILPIDPFVSLDEAGVGQLIKIGVERGRSARSGLKVGICGEHGGDPDSVMFCHRTGLDYVSCSPFRVPVARLAAAHAALGAEGSA